MLVLAVLIAGLQPQSDKIEFRVPNALIVDKAGKPLFRAPRDFLLTVAGNAEGRVLEYDPALRRVLVSPHNSWYVSCDYLQPQSVACAATPTRRTRSVTFGDLVSSKPETAPGETAGIPACPGDPRCPKGL